MALVSMLLSSCAEAPPNGGEGYQGRPWFIMSREDWSLVPAPGDSLIETQAVFGPLRRDPSWNPVRPAMLGELSEFWSGVAYADYGGRARIAECTVEKGVLVRVAFVAFRNRNERRESARMLQETK